MSRSVLNLGVVKPVAGLYLQEPLEHHPEVPVFQDGVYELIVELNFGDHPFKGFPAVVKLVVLD